MMQRLVVVGPGRVGLALGHALVQAEAVGRLVYFGRRPDPPSHPLFAQGLADYRFGLALPPPGTEAVILTVPDAVLAEMAHALAGQGRPETGAVALHTSGALSADVLAPLHAVGYAVGSLHPLATVAHPVTAVERFRGAGFAVSGEPQARVAARRIVSALDGTALEVPVGRRALHHAAVGMASGGVAALLAVAGGLLVRAGADPDDAVAVLAHLARGTLDDVVSMGLGRGLTGPVVEGDLETVDLHLRALEGDEREVYRILGRTLLEVARARGVESDAVDALRLLLQPPQGGATEEPT